MRTPIIAGNWKMHKTIAEAVELTRSVRRGVMDTSRSKAPSPVKSRPLCWPNCVNTSSWVTPSDASILVRQTKA
jgi:hypothetical protein